MAKFDICEFNYITSGKKQNTFNFAYSYTDDGMIQNEASKPSGMSAIITQTFFGDVGKYDTMSQRYDSNKASMYDIDNKRIIHNVYDLSKTPLKTTSNKASYMSDEKIDIYVPQISNDFLNLVQFKNYAFGLTRLTTDEPIMLNTIYDQLSKFKVSYCYQLSNEQIQTILYPRPTELSIYDDSLNDQSYDTYTEWIDNNQSLSNTIISSIFNFRRVLIGINYNKLIEIPEDVEYNDYSKGYIQCNQIVMKNHLNYAYTLCTDVNSKLCGCREYCNVNVCGNQLYATYRDNVNYNSESEQDHSEYQISVHNMEMASRQNSYTYQHIEVINSWNKFDNSKVEGHKSSMFSISLIDTGLNSSSINDNVKQKLRQTIMNSVRSIINAIAPANTQLFKVYFEGK